MTCCFPFVCGCWHLSFETRGFGKWHTNKYVMGLKREGYVMMQHSDDTGVHELSVVKAKYIHKQKGNNMSFAVLMICYLQSKKCKQNNKYLNL
jgi:hypothetical protein